MRLKTDAAGAGARVYVDGIMVGTVEGYVADRPQLVEPNMADMQWPGLSVGDTVFAANSRRGKLLLKCRGGRHALKILSIDGRSVVGSFEALGDETQILISIDRGLMAYWMAT